MTKIEKLKRWMKSKKTFETHDVVQWGLENYFISADRRKRELMEQGLVVKLYSVKREALYKWITKKGC